MPKDSNALSLVTAKSAESALLAELPNRLLAKLATIRRMDRCTVHVALQIGALLWQVKAALPHGKFQPWVKEHMQGKSYRSCAYYMKLTLAFAEVAKPSAAAMAALAAYECEGTPQTEAETEICAAVDDFVSDKSLTELLIKYGITGVGLKSELTEGDKPTLSAGEQLELVWSQSFETTKSLADLLTEKAAALTPDQRGAIEAELTRALDALRRV